MHGLPLLHCSGRPDLRLLQLLLQLLLMLRLLALQVAQLRLGLCSLLSIHSSLQQGSHVCRAPMWDVACMHQVQGQEAVSTTLTVHTGVQQH